MTAGPDVGARRASPGIGVDALLALADDELVLGWRDSEWTGIAPFLEEDVAFSSIAQTEIGHARAFYELAAAELGTTADALAFDRPPEEYRSAQLVELRLVHDWARTIARHVLYETADAVRIADLAESSSADVAGLARKIQSEEAYHLLHAQMWADRLAETDEGRRRLLEALEELWPYALGLLDGDRRERFVAAAAARLPFFAPPNAAPVERDEHSPEWAPLWEEMTMVRRSAPGGEW
jgi:ring-1,2-phenylacetyl-CoA epoxidase subunit PaaC